MYEQLIVSEQKSAREQVIAEHAGHLHLMDYMIGNVFNEYYSTLELVRNANEVVSYLHEPTADHREEVRHFFQRMITNRPYITGILLNIQNNIEDVGYSVATGNIGEESDVRDYHPHMPQLIATSHTMQDDEFFFTSPTEDVLTAIPLRLHDGSRGVVSMVVERDHMISMLDQFFVEHPDEIHFVLLSNTNNILFSDVEDPLKYAELTQNLQAVFPELLQKLTNDGTTISLLANGINYHVLAFNPFSEHAPYYEDHPFYLMGTVIFSDADVINTADSFLLRNRPLRWVLALLVILIGGFINLLVYFRKSDRELLSVSNLVSDQSHDGVVITDTLNHVTYCNTTFELMTGLSWAKGQSGGHKVFDLDGQPFKTQHALNTGGDLPSWKGTVWLQGKDYCALSYLQLTSVSSRYGHIVHTVGLYAYPRNLSYESSTAVFQSAHTDQKDLDQFPLQLITERLKNQKRFVLVSAKLTNLDSIEAQFTLEEHYHLGALIRNRIREGIGTNELLIQYTPDTFLLTVYESSGSTHAAVQHLRDLFRQPIVLGGKKVVITARCGVSLDSQTIVHAAAMLRQAKMALAAQEHYEQEGILQYDATINDKLLRYYAILQAIPQALLRHEIMIYYQPVVTCTGSRIAGAEALVRWNHPSLGFISPGEFIPIIEQNQLERKLGRYVVETVADYLEGFISDQDETFAISVNLCPTELQDPDLVDHIVRTLDAHHVPHHALVVELTERTLLLDMEVANRVLKLLHTNGIQVAIDDFGTGFSSLSYLHELDVDVLKIDRSFIKDYPQSDDGVILKAMVTMAKELNIPVQVEGIETVEQLQFMKELSVPVFQGFYYSPAITPESFRQLLSDQ
jgi:EAL domain-containing protein (putative c-di-GMP-specific phosphodiesterase class I)/GGDEF domain-containing protein